MNKDRIRDLLIGELVTTKSLCERFNHKDRFQLVKQGTTSMTKGTIVELSKRKSGDGFSYFLVKEDTGEIVYEASTDNFYPWDGYWRKI